MLRSFNRSSSTFYNILHIILPETTFSLCMIWIHDKLIWLFACSISMFSIVSCHVWMSSFIYWAMCALLPLFICMKSNIIYIQTQIVFLYRTSDHGDHPFMISCHHHNIEEMKRVNMKPLGVEMILNLEKRLSDFCLSRGIFDRIIDYSCSFLFYLLKKTERIS